MGMLYTWYIIIQWFIWLQEAAPVPQLEKFVQDKHCMSMGMLWGAVHSYPP